MEDPNQQKITNHFNILSNEIGIDQHYTYEILNETHIDEVVTIFTRAFCGSEPMTHYLQLDEAKYKIFARAVTKKACEDKLSVVALDKNRVIACALVEDLAAPGNLPDFDPKFVYILSLLDSLGHSFFANKKFATKHIAHLFITAVDPDYRHKGLSKQVNFFAMDLAAQKGFDFIYCELTHPYNEKGIISHLKNSKRLIGSAIYKDFVYNNIKPFEHLNGEAHSYLWAIHENAKLIYTENNKKIVENF